jgi:hypothetical protein
LQHNFQHHPLSLFRLDICVRAWQICFSTSTLDSQKSHLSLVERPELRARALPENKPRDFFEEVILKPFSNLIVTSPASAKMKDSQTSSTRSTNAKELEQYIASLDSYLARPNGRPEKSGSHGKTKTDNGRSSGAKTTKSDNKSPKQH